MTRDRARESPGATAGDRSESVVVVAHADDTYLDRVAIVTGGSRGIGREVAHNLAGRGYAVIVDYARNQRDADAVVEEILAANGTALSVCADVADELDVERLFTETAEAFGAIDVVVHAAAGRVILGPVVDYDLDTFDALLRTNVRGAFVVNQQAARQLRDGGAIVNVSSSRVGTAAPSDAAYAASDAAVEAITQVLARELRGRNITVNVVTPALEPPCALADVAAVVAFLASEDGHSISGQVIRSNPSRSR